MMLNMNIIRIVTEDLDIILIVIRTVLKKTIEPPQSPVGGEDPRDLTRITSMLTLTGLSTEVAGDLCTMGLRLGLIIIRTAAGELRGITWREIATGDLLRGRDTRPLQPQLANMFTIITRVTTTLYKVLQKFYFKWQINVDKTEV